MALTDEDKQWIAAQLAKFATKDDLEQRLAKFATKDDLEQRLAKFATKSDLEQRLAKFATKDDLEQMETKLLTAFHSWASPAESRMRAFKAALNALDSEFEALKDRVKKLEPPGTHP